MTAHILITRPQGDESPLSDALMARGFQVTHEPLTEIFLKHTVRTALDKALRHEPDAIILTSRHGAQALAALSELRDLSLLCVGEATAQAAYSTGFSRVDTAGGDVDHLIEIITGAYDEGSRFIYVSAEHTRIDLPAVLATHGMEVDHIRAYEAIASTQLSDNVVEQIKNGEIDGVTFFSQRSAVIFMALAKQTGIDESIASMYAFALSDAVAEPLIQASWKEVVVADEPTLASLVESVDNTFLTKG